MCGVFGVWAPGEDVAKLTYFGLYSLQHRGQESAGIAVSNGRQILVYKDMGLVSQAFDETTLDSLKGHLAVGHCRYSTTGASTWQNAQPTFRPTADGSIALGHNGNLINTHEIAQMVEDLPDPDDEIEGLHSRQLEASTNDTGLVTALLAHHPDTSLEQRALEVLPQLEGAFSFVWMNEDTLYAARDPEGIRPLVLGRLDTGWVVASEDAALATIGASVVREVEPGELIAIDEHGLRTHRFAEQKRKGCVFEYVYLARPDATIAGQNVHKARVEMGRELARQFPVEADLVMPVPESGTPAAAGYAAESRDPVRPGLRQERLRRPHLHPTQPDPAPARHPTQAQRARPHGPGQEAGGRRRLDRPRQHPARPGPDAPRGGCARGARPDLLAAGEVAVLLRHRLRHPRRADRQRARRRGDPRQHRRRQPRLHHPGRDDRGDRPGAVDPVHRVLHRRVPDRAARPEPARQAPAGVLDVARRPLLPVLNNP